MLDSALVAAVQSGWLCHNKICSKGNRPSVVCSAYIGPRVRTTQKMWAIVLFSPAYLSGIVFASIEATCVLRRDIRSFTPTPCTFQHEICMRLYILGCARARNTCFSIIINLNAHLRRLRRAIIPGILGLYKLIFTFFFLILTWIINFVMASRSPVPSFFFLRT